MSLEEKRAAVLQAYSPGAVPLTSEFAERIAAVTEGVVVDLDEPIEGEVDL